jgi:hypothetical protein
MQCIFLGDDESKGIMSPKLSLPAFVYETADESWGGGGGGGVGDVGMAA